MLIPPILSLPPPHVARQRSKAHAYHLWHNTQEQPSNPITYQQRIHTENINDLPKAPQNSSNQTDTHSDIPYVPMRPYHACYSTVPIRAVNNHTHTGFPTYTPYAYCIHPRYTHCLLNPFRKYRELYWLLHPTQQKSSPHPKFCASHINTLLSLQTVLCTQKYDFNSNFAHRTRCFAPNSKQAKVLDLEMLKRGNIQNKHKCLT